MKTAEYPPTLGNNLSAAGFEREESSLNLGICSPGTLRNLKFVVNGEGDVDGAAG
jgi:hypothetical protein